MHLRSVCVVVKKCVCGLSLSHVVKFWAVKGEQKGEEGGRQGETDSWVGRMGRQRRGDSRRQRKEDNEEGREQ